MKHPDELLAECVDGTLQGAVYADVRAHVAACARCREEVQLAAAARGALGGMAEAPVPEDLMAAVVAQGEREAADRAPEVVPMRSRRAPGVPAWYRWAGVAGVAAAAVLVVAVALPNLGGRDTGEVTMAGAPEDRSAPTAPVQLEVQDADYDEALVQGLVEPYGGEVAGAASDGPSTQYAESGDAAVEPAGTSEALACLDQAFTTQDGEALIDGQLVRLIRARFKGEPVYIGVYLTGPGAGEPPDRANVWVANAEDCSVVSATQATL